MEQRALLGILTGISYVSGLDYFKGINENYLRLASKGKYLMSHSEINAT
jgi:hypothetical protein